MNPMDTAWRLLKELTPEQQTKVDQMAQFSPEAAEQMRQMMEQENAVRQQQAPQHTERTRAIQAGLDAQRKEREEAGLRRRIRAQQRRNSKELRR